MATIDEIRQQAEAVKNASHVGENTALRVGGVLVDLCEWMKKLSDNAGNGGGGTSGGSGVSLGTLLTKLNTDNPFPTSDGQVLTYSGSDFIWKSPTGSSGGSSSNRYSFTIYNGSSNTDFITYDGSSAAYLRFKSGFSISKTGLGYEISASGGSGVTLNPTMDAMNKHLDKTKYGTPQFLYWDGSTYTWKDESEISGSGGSSSRIDTIKLFNSLGNEFDSVNLGSGNTIGFMQGDNVTLQAIVKNHINVIKISAKGGSGGSTSTSVSWSDVTNKPSTFTPSSHTHSTSDISGLSNYVQGITVNNADKATQLANPRLIWGQSFNGTGDINGNLKMGTAGGGSIQLWMNGDNMLDRTDNTLHIGYGLKASSDGEIWLDAYATRVYTSNYSNHYDFKGNVFDVNSNQIHFGSENNGGTLSWDSANKCFKINGSVYATGGITALGVSNNATTSNNVDFTFNSVTSKRNIIYADDNMPFKIYPKNNTDNPLVFKYDGAHWNIYDENIDNLILQGNCIIDSDGWVYSPQFLSDENGNMSLNGSSFTLGDTDNDVNVLFYYNGSRYKLDMSKAISIGVFTKLSTQELSTLQERKTKKKAVS